MQYKPEGTSSRLKLVWKPATTTINTTPWCWGRSGITWAAGMQVKGGWYLSATRVSNGWLWLVSGRQISHD